MSVFKVDYCQKGKPTGTRKFLSMQTTSYEDALFSFTLDKLCLSIYKVEYWWPYLNDNLFIHRVSANAKLCVYDVMLFDMQNRMKLLADYEVTIECIMNDSLEDIFEEANELTPVQERKIPKPLKSKQLTEWVKNESTPIKGFLILLDHAKSLKKLREGMSKATYYRNLKICQEKGYIEGNKLVKRIFVRKND